LVVGLSLIKKRKKWNSHGVSEVVGNLLILAITVTLFSSVLMFVSNMPTPDENVVGDFIGELDTTSGVIELSYKSGPALKDFRTAVVFIIDNNPTSLTLADADNVAELGDTWKIGESFVYDATAIGSTTATRVEVMVLDTESNSIVWSDTLKGVSGQFSPLITDRWVEVNSTDGFVEAAGLLQRQDFSVHANVLDRDGDLTQVTVDLSSVGLGASAAMTYDASSNEWCTTTQTVPDDAALGEMRLRITAVDSQGASTYSNLAVTVESYTSQPPIILYGSIDPSSSLQGTTFQVSCYATDPNNDLDHITVTNEVGVETFGQIEQGFAYPSVDRVLLMEDDDNGTIVGPGESLSITSWLLDGLSSSDLDGQRLDSVYLAYKYYTDEYYVNTNSDRITINGNDWLLVAYDTNTATAIQTQPLINYNIDTFSEISDLDIAFENTGEGNVTFDALYVYFSYMELGTNLSSSIDMIKDPNNPGYYTSTGSAKYALFTEAQKTYYYSITAYDMTGNEVTVRVSHTIMKTSSFYNGGGGGSDRPEGLEYSSMQGFNLFEYNDWTDLGFDADSATVFDHDDLAVVVVASKYLVNTEMENTLMVMDPETKQLMPVTMLEDAFEYFDYTSGYYIYNTTIDMSELPAGEDKRYSLTISLRDSWVPNNIFYATQMISVGGEVLYPSMETFEDAACTIPSNNFDTSEIIYVKVTTEYPGEWDPWGGDVEIRDFFWNQQVKRMPYLVYGAVDLVGWNGPVSNVWKLTPNEFVFAIDLERADQEPWQPGTNAYILRYDMFIAGTEKYVLDHIVTINAPKITLDIVASSDRTSTNAWGVKNCIYYYNNDDQWYPAELVETGGNDKDRKECNVVRLGDMDGNGKTDIVASVYADGQFHLYFYKNDGEWTRKLIADLGSVEPLFIELGNMDYDNDLDVVVALDNGNIAFYRNDGVWTYSLIDTGSDATALTLGDIDKDGTNDNVQLRSLDILVGRQGVVALYKNNGIGVFASAEEWRGQGFANEISEVTAEYANSATVTGLGNTVNPNDYENITEIVDGDITTATVPSAKNTDNPNYATDALTKLQEDDDNDFAVLSGKYLWIENWNVPQPSGNGNVVSVEFTMEYRTNNQYNTNDQITFGLNPVAEPINPLYTVTGSTSRKTVGPLSIDKTTYGIETVDNLVNLELYFDNTDNNGDVYFDYWMLTVEVENDGAIVEYVWEFDVRAGNQYLMVKTQRVADANADNFTFQYSTDMITYADLFTLTDDELFEDEVVIPLSTEYAGPIYIKLVDEDVEESDPTLNSVLVYRMGVNTTYTISAQPPGEIRGLQIVDLDNDGKNDLVIGDEDQIWVRLNADSNHVFDGFSDFTQNTPLAVGSGVLNIAVGDVVGFGSVDENKDIVFSTSTRIYVLRQGPSVTFSTADMFVFAPPSDYGISSYSILKMVGGDVDGDGDMDLVFSTTGSQSGNSPGTGGFVVYITNYGMSGTDTWLTDWTLVGELGTNVLDLDIGRVSNG
jgi:hypothetical protein